MTQLDIFQWLEQQPKDSKRLVKSDLHTIDYKILDYLKKHALGSKNKVSGLQLADAFGFDTTSKVRQHIKRLRVNPTVDVIIGSDSKGYWIPLAEEFEESVQFMTNKVISEVETLINMSPRSAKLIQAVCGSIVKKVDTAVEGQMQIQFNDWEREIIKRFADKYKDKE